MILLVSLFSIDGLFKLEYLVPLSLSRVASIGLFLNVGRVIGVWLGLTSELDLVVLRINSFVR